jgi:hypothetical protein
MPEDGQNMAVTSTIQHYIKLLRLAEIYNLFSIIKQRDKIHQNKFYTI